jgi:hypothetical protein
MNETPKTTSGDLAGLGPMVCSAEYVVIKDQGLWDILFRGQIVKTCLTEEAANLWAKLYNREK